MQQRWRRYLWKDLYYPLSSDVPWLMSLLVKGRVLPFNGLTKTICQIESTLLTLKVCGKCILMRSQSDALYFFYSLTPDDFSRQGESAGSACHWLPSNYNIFFQNGALPYSYYERSRFAAQ